MNGNDISLQKSSMKSMTDARLRIWGRESEWLRVRQLGASEHQETALCRMVEHPVPCAGIIPHIPVWDKSQRDDGTVSRSEFKFDRKAERLYLSGRRDTEDERAGLPRSYYSLLCIGAPLPGVQAETPMLPKHASPPDFARRQRGRRLFMGG